MNRGRLAAIAVGAVVLLFAIYSVLLAPKGKQLKAQRAKLSEAQSQEESLKATLRRLQALALQRPARQAELARLASAVPNTPDLAGFIVSADKLATDSGVDWVSVSPSVPSAGAANTPSTIAMSIQVQGGFFQVLDYLNRLEHLERVVVVDSVNLSATDNGTASPPITVNLSARMFTSAPAARTGSAGAGGATGATTTTAPGTPTTTAGSVTTATTRPASP